MAKKLKFQKTKAGGADKIRDDISRSSGFGNMLWIKGGDSKSIRILAEPKDWEKYSFLRYEELKVKGKLPIYSGWKDDFPEVAAEDPRIRQAHVVPVAVINEESGKAERFMFWEPAHKPLKDLLAHFDRRKTVMDRDWDVVREGTTMNDTSYTIIPDDPSKRSEVSKLTELDFDDELVRMVEEFTAAYASYSGEEPDEEEDEKPSKKSKSKKGKPSKRMEEPEDDDEPSEEEEEEADGDDGSDEEGEGEDAPDFDEMDIDELKAAAKELGVKVPKGSKSPTYRKLLKAAVEAEEEEPEEEEEAEDEGGAESITATFVVTDIDARAFTASTTDGEEDREVYFDRQQHDLDEIEEGGSYTFTIEQDEDLDWIVMSEVVEAKKSKPAKKGKGKK